MRRILLTIFFFLCFFSISTSFATPPTSISLKYDLVKGSLHVEAIHPSFDLQKSYVRLMIVYLNDAQVTTLNYYRQNDYNKFIEDVPVNAQIGDIIKVDLFCQLGGEMSQELTVTNQAAQPDQNSATATKE